MKSIGDGRGAGQGATMGHGKKVTVDLRANESLTVEVPLTEGGESLYARFWLWLVSSGKWAAMSGAARAYPLPFRPGRGGRSWEGTC